ncbi:cytochrome C [bacterium]|nr:cytochrome C [bacterium]
MSQIFHPSTNAIARATIFGAILIVGAILALLYFYYRSPYETQVGVVQPQPVPFSHEHHVSGLGIDCRYCHTSVEESSFAGIPPTHTCMTCHSQIWVDSPMLEPVRQSYQTGIPLPWVRVHDMADFVYFNHAVHVNNGIGCASCHGDVGNMPLVAKAEPMTMGWCLECHRDPARNVRPQEEIFNMQWQPPPDQHVVGEQLLAEYGIEHERLSDCYICHR